MSRTTLLAVIAILSLLGVADSFYLAEHALTNTALSCGVGSLSGCNVVAQSAYSHFLGIPLGVYGLAFYLAVFLLTIATYARHSKHLARLLFTAASTGLLLSLYFVGLQLFVIDAICVYCFGSFFLSVGIFIAARSFMRGPHHHVPVPVEL